MMLNLVASFSIFHSHFSINILSFVLDTPLAASLELTVACVDPLTGRRRKTFVHLWESNYVFYVFMWFYK